MTESRIILSQCATYLASSHKSNASYMAINQAQSLVKQTGDLSVPLHIRNAPTQLMKNLNYGKGYRYDHDSADAYSGQEHLPDKLVGQKLYLPKEVGFEREIKKRMEWWEKKKVRTEDREA